MKTTSRFLLLAGAAFAAAATAHSQVTTLIDFGNDSTFRGVTASSPDINGNHWNSVAFGFVGNLVDTTGSATAIDWTPNGLGDTDSFNSLVGATTSPDPTATELSNAETILNGGSIGDFGVAEAAIDFFVSNNGTTDVGRFQIQQLTPGQEYDLSFYGARQFTNANTQTRYSVFDDSSYTNLLGSVTVTHGDGGSNGNITDVGTISGLIGPSNANNIFYVQFEGVNTSTAGYINAMSITAVPEPSTYALLAGVLALGLIVLRRRR
jgi:hypothetical protein